MAASGEIPGSVPPTVHRRRLTGGVMKPSPERIARVQALKQTLRTPMTRRDKVEFRCQIAAVRAEDERRREPSPQLQLGAVA